MQTREMLRQSWRAWLSRGAPRVGPWWMDHVWTVLFSLAVALGFLVLFSSPTPHDSWATWLARYGAMAVVSLAIGFSVRSTFWIAARLIGGEARVRTFKPWQRALYFSAVPMIGVVIGWPIGMFLALGIDVRRFFPLEQPAMLAGSVLIVLFITVVFQQFFWSKARQIQAENRAAEAQLRLLQAQMEPHFLFNTLANVASLMEADPSRAKAMLEAFVDYLRGSLSGLGEGRHTLGDEIDLIDAYMRIVKIRMEDRLDYAIDVPAALRTLPLPALTLQPLVENAIVHGLEPMVAGGTVRIAARTRDGSLVITVDDDGAGLAAAASAPAPRRGAGAALANIRKRLEQGYGSGATLSLEPGAPRGVHAHLSLPIAP